jgi:hypothetical protein
MVVLARQARQINWTLTMGREHDWFFVDSLANADSRTAMLWRA